MNDQAEDRPQLIVEFLRDRAAPCPMCGYDLKDQATPRCPECGTELELQLKPVRLRMYAWITGLVGLSAGLGFNGMILVWFLWHVGLEPRYFDWKELWSLYPGTGVCGVLAYLWLRGNRWIRRRSGVMRWCLAMATWIISITFAAWFFAQVG